MDIKPLLKTDWVLFYNSFLDNRGVKKILQNIKIAKKVIYLKLKFKEPKILETFFHIKFKTLKILNISYTDIDSL